VHLANYIHISPELRMCEFYYPLFLKLSWPTKDIFDTYFMLMCTKNALNIHHGLE